MNKHTAELLETHFDTAFAAPDGIDKLRKLILTLAMQGKLVEQDPDDQPAAELLKEIEAEKQRLVKAGRIKRPKDLLPIKSDEVPYELPQGWEWVRLGEAMLKITDGTHHSPPNSEKGDFLYISAKNIKDDGVLLSNATYVTKEIHKEIFSRCDPEFGNILYIKDGATTGIVTINNLKEPFSMLSSVALLKQPSQVDNRYLLFSLRAPFFYEERRAGMTGVAITRVTLKILHDAIIPLPPLPEQHRIVARIDQLMARCDDLEKLRKEREEKRLAVHAAAIKQLLDAPDGSAWDFIQQHFGELYTVKENVAELRKAILQLAVMGRLVSQDAGDPPASELLKVIEAEKQRLVKAGKIKKPKPLPLIKPEELPYQLPQGWEWVRVIDLVDVGTGSTPATTNRDYYGGTIPWYTSSATNKLIADKPETFITEKAIKETNCKVFPSGSLIIALYGQGKTRGQISELVVAGATNQAIAAMVFFDSSSGIKKFLKYFFMKIYEEIRELAEGAAQPNLNVGKVKETLVPLPPLPEQHRIVARIDQLMALCDSLERQVNAASGKQSALLSVVMAQV